MNRLFALAVASLVLSLTVVGVACQTYDLGPVSPLTLAQTTQSTVVTAHTLKPNVMLLVDKSGSMSGPIDATDPACPAGCGPGGPACPAACKTRISELRSAMTTFLASHATTARLGLSFFPSDTSCGATAAVTVPFPSPTADDTGTDATLTAQANAISAKIAAVAPGGGTPTADSLTFVGSDSSLNQADFRADYVVLLTDGLPNCNGANQNNACQCNPALCGSCASASAVCPAQLAACGCTTSSCGPGTALCARGCLDGDGTATAVAALNTSGVKTVVVGFGADTSGGSAATVLDAMARAGGVPRTCPGGLDSECDPTNSGVDGCNPTTKLCRNAFYQATSGAALGDTLDAIWGGFEKFTCNFVLDSQPSDPSLLSVLVDGVDVPAGADTWSYTAGAVVFAPNGSACETIQASTTAHPVSVEIRSVQRL
jgi:hypothetical protein